MARAADRLPQIQFVNSVGGVLEGPYPLAVSQGAAANLGIWFEGADAGEEDVHAGPWTNFQWRQMSQSFGYRLHASLRFVGVESDPSSSFYGLTLLHRIWKAGREHQVTAVGLQFKMYSAGLFRPIIVTSPQWQPQLLAGKQGLYEVSIDIATWDLVPVPGEWAQSQW